MYPVFSPDGTEIAYFVANQDASGILRVIDASGATRDVATDLGCALEDKWPPAWSPDGRFIIYPINKSNCASPYESLRIVAADGTSAPRVLFGSSVTGPTNGADWSSDGTAIAFQHYELGSSSLWVADVTDLAAPFDLAARRVSPADVASYAKGSWQGPRWSPDSTMLATIAAPVGPGILTDVTVISKDGASLWKPLPVDLGTGDEIDPGWDPVNGKLVTAVLGAASSSNTDGYTIYQVAIGDATTEPLAAELRSAPPSSGWARPHYSNGGEYLAYRLPSSTSDGWPGDLYLRDLSFLNGGGEVTIVAAGPSEPSWQPRVAPLPPSQPIP